MIECVTNSSMPVCQRSMDSLLKSDFWCKDQGLRFDPEFLASLPELHGATPIRQYFRDSAGTLRRLGWFVTMYDMDSELSEPRREDHMYQDSDTRIIDRSLIYLLGGESSIYRPLENASVRYYPFAALYTDPLIDSEPLTLCWHHGSGNDCVCFDTSTDPISVVVCEFSRAVDAFTEYDSELDNRYDYQFLIPVAPSFSTFAEMLGTEP